MIHFVTGNKKKFEEAREILGDVEHLEMDLPELQDLDIKKVIEFKLKEALKHHVGPLIVEDTSLELEALNGLPGPFIKWFQKTIGDQGIVNLAEKLKNNKALARVIIGYAKSKSEIKFFEGKQEGTLVSPRGSNGFGWDVIFVPKGYDRTFAQMSKGEKNKISHRRKALQKLKEFLNK